jgi:hypothetical protein
MHIIRDLITGVPTQEYLILMIVTSISQEKDQLSTLSVL